MRKATHLLGAQGKNKQNTPRLFTHYLMYRMRGIGFKLLRKRSVLALKLHDIILQIEFLQDESPVTLNEVKGWLIV